MKGEKTKGEPEETSVSSVPPPPPSMLAVSYTAAVPPPAPSTVTISEASAPPLLLPALVSSGERSVVPEASMSPDFYEKSIFPTAAVSGVTLDDLARTFGLLGFTSFGGGAVMGLIQDRVVRVRRWLSNRAFIESMALGQSLPGPIGPNVITYIGYRLCGAAGAAVALLSFILPSFFLMVALAFLYERTQSIPAVGRLFFGLNPAVAGLIAATTFRLGKTTMRTVRQRWQILLVYAIVVIYPHLVLTMIFLSVAGGALWVRIGGGRGLRRIAEDSIAPAHRRAGRKSPLPKLLVALTVVGGLVWAARCGAFDSVHEVMLVWMQTHKLFALAYISLKLGAFTFGGGYVMVPLMEHDVVTNYHWVTHREFVDGMALGQLTPGPFVITVTFIGYRVAGLPGAIVGTVGIFIVPFLLTIWAGRSMDRFRRSVLVQGALSGVAPTAIALLGAAATSLAITALLSAGKIPSLVAAAMLFVSSALVFARYSINPLYILAGCTFIGWFFAA